MIRKLFILTIIIGAVIAILYYANFSVVKEKVDDAIATYEEKKIELSSHKANAIRQARKLLDQNLKSGYDLENRPCLAQEIVPGWAVDVTHYPVEEIDKLPQNQCQSYLEGKVENLILMDEFGHEINKDGIRMGI